MEQYSVSDVNSQELENCLKNLPERVMGGYDSQEIINDTLKFEEEIEARNRNMEQKFLPNHSPTGCNPSTVEFSGNFNFSAIPDNLRSDCAWEYSKPLQQVFINVNKIMVMKFSVDSYQHGLFIRALPVFSSCSYSQYPVDRCPAHSKKDDPEFKAHSLDGSCMCVQYNLAGHVLRCHSLTALYQFDSSSGRHSVIFPLPFPQAGSDYVTQPFSFACKTSCASGMQRRPIYVIFTLENEYCEVLGRQLVRVKICACPKRDKERSERDHYESGGSDPNLKGRRHLVNKKGNKDCKRSPAIRTTLSDYLTKTKKVKLTPLVQVSSDTDNSEYEVDSLMKDLEYVMQSINQQQQQYKKISEKLIRMCTKLKKIKYSQLNSKPCRDREN